jgi:hypothetical protein
MKSEKLLKIFAATLAVGLVVMSAQAQTIGNIYDNSVTDQGSNIILTNNQQLGQEILPALGSTPYLHDFSYEFYGSFSGTIQGKVQFYNNGSSGGTPTTKFYDSGWYNLVSPGGISLVNFGWQDLYAPTLSTSLALNAQVQLPTDFTVVFSFQGLTSGDVVGLANFNPPVVGNNYALYWQNNGTEATPSWGLISYQSGGQNLGVGMQMNGLSQPVPEPSVIALGALGAFLMTQVIRRRKA